MNLNFRNSIRFTRIIFAWLLLGPAAHSTSVAQSPLGESEGLPVVGWKDARQVVGRKSIVGGKIVRVGHTEKIHFLNFALNDRDAFSVVIFSPNDEKFPDKLEPLFLNKLVAIRGTVTLFRGNPQIVVTEPKQVSVVDELPETHIPQQRMLVLGNELTVGSFNIKNLFDDHDDPYHNDETTPAKPREEMEGVAAVIREVNPDVLALQEVENRGYLERFVGTMLSDRGYEHVVLYEGNDHRGIDVCLISRVPIGAVTSNRHLVFAGAHDAEQSFSRDLLQVEMLPENGDSFEMWVVHLKSNHGGRETAEPIRLGEARELHRIIAQRLHRDPEAEFILCGDFNDTFDSATIQTILGDPPLLVAHFQDIAEDERITYNREPYRTMIDFMLCSPAMARRYVSGSFHVRLGSDRDSGSDHNPIYARFLKSAGDRSRGEKTAGSRGTTPLTGNEPNDALGADDSATAISTTAPVDSETSTVHRAASATSNSPDTIVERWHLLAWCVGLGITVLSLAAIFRWRGNGKSNG